MFPSERSGRSSQPPMQDRSLSLTLSLGPSSPSSLRSSQAYPGDRYSSKSAYLRETTEHESQLDLNLIYPPSSSLEQIPTERSNSGSQRTRPAPLSNSYLSLYNAREQELFAEPGSSHQQQLSAGAISSSSHSNRGHQSLHGSALALPVAPNSSNSGSSSGSLRLQSATADGSVPETSQGLYTRYPGVTCDKGRWRARWVDPTQRNRRVSIGSFDTQSEAINALNAYKAPRNESLSQQVASGLYRKSSGRWKARYRDQGKQIYVGTFETKEAAESALNEHRAARRLPPAMASSRKRQ